MTASLRSADQFGYDRLLHRITNRIRQSLELPDILHAAAVEVRAFLGTDRVKIYQFHPDQHGEVIAESIQNNRLPSLLGLHFPADDIPVESRQAFIHMRQRVIVDVAKQQNRLERLSNSATDNSLHPEDIRYRPVDPCHLAYLTTMGVQSSLVMPILHHTDLWGLLVSHHSEPHDFSTLELDIVQLVVDQLSIAIAQATLLTETRNQAQQQATINQIALSLSPLTELDFQTGLQKTIDALQCAGGRLYQTGSATKAPLLYTHGLQPLPPPFLPATILEEDILWRDYFRIPIEAHHPSLYALPDLGLEPRLRALAPIFLNQSIRGLLVLPLVYRQEFWGYLTLFRTAISTQVTWAGQVDPDHRQTQPRQSFAAWKEERRAQAVPWTAEDISLAQILATQFAATLHEYDLYHQVQLENQQRQQVEQTLRRQAEEERLRYTILQRIRQSLKLTTILDTTVAEVRHFLHTDRVLIYQFEPTWSGHVVAESVSSHDLSIFGQVIHDPCFESKKQYLSYQQGRVSQITNIHDLALLPCYIQMLESLHVQANLVVPILLSYREDRPLNSSPSHPEAPKLWGLLIAHNCHAPRQWEAWEVNFLQQLATQVAIALNQAELYEQVRALNADLEHQVQIRTTELQQALDYESLLKRITDKVRDSLDETQILQSAVEELTHGLELLRCDAVLFDLEQRTVTVCYEHLSHPGIPAIGARAAMDAWPELYDLLLSGYYFQFCLLPEAPRILRDIPHPHTVFICPMIDDQGALGDMCLSKPSTEYFVDLEVRLIQQVANQCAIAIRQARLYQSAQAQVQELARLNQLKDDFLSTVSHELRTPMSNIKMATQMLEVILQENITLAEAAYKAKDYLQIVNAECKREIDLINDLLDLTRLDAETDPLSLITIELSLWIPHIVESFNFRMDKQHQRCEILIPADLPPITTDLSYLERIISELLNNACKYTPAEGLIQIACQLADPQAFQIQITNTGVEIADRERDRIFDKFYRIPNNDPWKYGGTGLGLALVKKLTEYLQGSIHVETQPNQTTFIVRLPNLAPPAQSAS